MNDTSPAVPDCLLEVDDNLYSLTAIIEAQATLRAANIDESSVVKNAIEEAADELEKTTASSICAAEDNGFTAMLLDKAVSNLRPLVFDRISSQLHEQSSSYLEERQEQIGALVDQTIAEAVNGAITSAQPILDKLTQGLRAKASLQHLIAGNASLPKNKSFYQGAVKERVTAYINTINSIIPADFPND